MKTVAVLHDALQGEHFAIAVKSDSGFEFFGAGARSNEWANWANGSSVKSLDGLDVPPGVVIGPFKEIDNLEFARYASNDESEVSSVKQFGRTGKKQVLKLTGQISSKSRVPAVADTPLRHFSNDKFVNAISYKASSFRSDVKRSSFLREVKSNRYAFDIESGQFNVPASIEVKSLIRNRIEANTSNSFERRLGLKMLKVSEYGRERTARGLEETLETKSLGATIGGSAGSGARAARRAGRMASGNFDPNAVDADGDKLVQEGTSFERPATPRVAGITKRTEAAKRGVKIRTESSGLKAAITGAQGRRALKDAGLVDWESDKYTWGWRLPEQAEKYFKENVVPLLPKTNRTARTNHHVSLLKNANGGKLMLSDVKNHLGLDISLDVMKDANKAKAFKKKLTSGDENVYKELFKNARIIDPKTNREMTFGDYRIELDGGLKSRRSASTTLGSRARRERATVQNGLASRKEKSKKRGTPGIDKVDASDGTAWGSLKPEQHDKIKKNLQVRRQELQDALKDSSDAWNAYLRNPKNVQRHKGINTSSDLTDDFLIQLQRIIEDNLDSAKGIDDDKKRTTAVNKIMMVQRQFDDLRTINNMNKEGGDYSLLEHLHPASRDAAVGRGTRKAGTKYVYEKTLEEGDKVPSLAKTKESTIFGKGAGEKIYVDDKKLASGERAIVKKQTDQKLKKLSRRLFDVNPKRAAKRQQRKNRAAGVAQAAQEAKPVEEAKARIRRAKRAIQAKLRGEESPAQVATRAKKNIALTAHPLGIKDDKDPNKAQYKVTDRFMSVLATIANEVGVVDTGEKRVSRESGDKHLLNLWENTGFNELPTMVPAETVERLIGAGWRPHNRGVGNDAGFAEAYLSEADRFIPGVGGRAYGVGEYWAPPGSGHAWGYGNQQVIGFVSPDARIIKSGDLSKIVNEGAEIHKAIRVFDSGYAEGVAEKMDPADYASELLRNMEKSVPKESPLWESPIGQIYSQVIDRYSKSGGDQKVKQEAWAALQQMNSMLSHSSGRSNEGYFAPLLGYDAINAGDVTLVHNRGAMIVLDRGTTIKEGQEIVKNGYSLRPQKAAA